MARLTSDDDYSIRESLKLIRGALYDLMPDSDDTDAFFRLLDGHIGSIRAKGDRERARRAAVNDNEVM